MLTLSIALSYGQSFSYPAIKSTGHSLKDFVPAGWAIRDSAIGDLNRDKLNDAVIVAQYKDSVTLVKPGEMADTVLTQPRILIILLKDAANNNFYVAEQSNSFILNNDNPTMDDPYQSIKIKNGLLQISFQLFNNMGGWNTTNSNYTFRYQANQFFLTGAGYFSINRATLDFEDYSYNFLTKKRSLTTGNDNKKTKKTSWKRLNINGLKTMQTFKQPYSWKVEEGVYL